MIQSRKIPQKNAPRNTKYLTTMKTPTSSTNKNDSNNTKMTTPNVTNTTIDSTAHKDAIGTLKSSKNPPEPTTNYRKVLITNLATLMSDPTHWSMFGI